MPDAHDQPPPVPPDPAASPPPYSRTDGPALAAPGFASVPRFMLFCTFCGSTYAGPGLGQPSEAVNDSARCPACTGRTLVRVSGYKAGGRMNPPTEDCIFVKGELALPLDGGGRSRAVGWPSDDAAAASAGAPEHVRQADTSVVNVDAGFGVTVRRLREQRNMTIDTLAHESMSTPATIAAIEAGTLLVPAIRTVKRIAHTLGVPWDWLLEQGRVWTGTADAVTRLMLAQGWPPLGVNALVTWAEGRSDGAHPDERANDNVSAHLADAYRLLGFDATPSKAVELATRLAGLELHAHLFNQLREIEQAVTAIQTRIS